MPWLNPLDALLKSHFSRPLVLCLLLSATAGLLAQTAHPIVYGDHPDPSIIRVGDTYWTASTSGDWAPEFPLYRSIDLEHWTAAGAVFPHTPEWAAGSFWAPELVADNGRVLVYYVGRKRDGPLCVAVATADVAEGPYTDHGPIVCQADGSIDPSFVRDEHGQPFLIWKEDGNSIGKPTPIWAQPLASDLLHMTERMTQLLVNDPSSWEGGVVEGRTSFTTQIGFISSMQGTPVVGLLVTTRRVSLVRQSFLGRGRRIPRIRLSAPTPYGSVPDMERRFGHRREKTTFCITPTPRSERFTSGENQCWTRSSGALMAGR